MEEWKDFYVMVGGAAAALTGLVLVAVSLHLKAVLRHPLYRDRAWSSLQGLVTAMLVSIAALTPQPLAVFGVEMAILALLWLARYTLFIGLYRGTRPQDRGALRSSEWVFWAGWTVALLVSGILMIAGNASGLYVLAGCVATGIVLIVWNAWVLLAEVSSS